MNKTKTRTGLSALFAVLLAIMIAVPAIFRSLCHFVYCAEHFFLLYAVVFQCKSNILQ